MKREPLLTTGFITALVGALLACLVAFGVDLSDDQQKALLGLAVVVAPLVVAVVTRPKVTPVADPHDANGRPLVTARTDWGRGA